ncbi:MAG: A/G-specific adenine glycosylase [Flavobacteriales bacterium]|nr:A/G-specific adenine glycosylase [Flavobacteriales bacterium]
MSFVYKIENWYKENKRELPWRKTKNPYLIWISEIIFQQTRINQGMEYYLNFVSKYPNLNTLAEDSLENVLKNWQGLGYYNRAKNIHYTANFIQNELNGVFPDTYKDLQKLKGVGKYTAAAIASICFDEKVPALDGNAFRVYTRFFGIADDISKQGTFTMLFDKIQKILPERVGDFNQAIMDFGSAVCTPKNAKCKECPLSVDCVAFNTGKVNELPFKKSKIKVKDETINYYVYYSENYIILEKRQKRSFWKDLYEFSTKSFFIDEKRSEILEIQHKLSHRNLTLSFNDYKLSDEELLELSNQNNLKYYRSLESITLPKPIENHIKTLKINL